MNDQLEELDAYCRSFLKPRPVQTCKEWIEANITIPSSVPSPWKGPYRTHHTPYVRGVYEALEDGNTHTVVLCWGAQSGKTLTLTNWLAWRIATDPAPIIFVMPTEHLARSFSETRLRPIFDACPEVVEQYHPNPDKLKILEMHFRGAQIAMVGSNSPSAVSSRPVEIAVLDELDKFAPPTNKEAAAFSLAMERTKAFPRRKHVLTSTPTMATADIWQQFIAGSQEYYFVPCPHCDHFQQLVFDRIKWASDCKGQDGKYDFAKVQATATYRCESCDGEITDSDKDAMLARGEWRATNKGEPGRRSMQISSLYSPQITWAMCATKFLTEKGYLQGLQNFVNSWLALPWEDQFNDEVEEITTLGIHQKGAEWDREKIRLAAIDRQIDHLWYVVRAYADDGSSRLIDEGRIQTVEDAYERICVGLKVKPKFVAMDSGYQTQDTYRVCARYGWTALKGEDRNSYTHHINMVPVRKVHSPPQMTDAGCMLLLFSSPACQDLLAWLRRGRGSDWQIASDVSPEYREHLKSHTKRHRIDRRTGRDIYEWVRVKSRPDHLYDCETMLCAYAAFGKLIQSEVSGIVDDNKKDDSRPPMES